jgi:glycerophosphoryl diester phosphodiesterase
VVVVVTDRPMLAIAHRGGNSLVDLRAALDLGVDLVEADIHLFRDALEVRHRKALGSHLYWERWCELDLRRNLVLPVLADVLAEARGDPRLMLDLKGPSLAVAPRVAALLRGVVPGAPLAVCTKQWRMLDAFDSDPHVRRVFSAANGLQLTRLRSRVRRTPAFGVSIHWRLLTPEIVAELHRYVTVVMAWPVETRATFDRMRRYGVSGVISRNLELLRRIVAQRDGYRYADEPG